jgi:hypothetical protein
MTLRPNISGFMMLCKLLRRIFPVNYLWQECQEQECRRYSSGFSNNNYINVNYNNNYIYVNYFNYFIQIYSLQLKQKLLKLNIEENKLN